MNCRKIVQKARKGRVDDSIRRRWKNGNRCRDHQATVNGRVTTPVDGQSVEAGKQRSAPQHESDEYRTKVSERTLAIQKRSAGSRRVMNDQYLQDDKKGTNTTEDLPTSLCKLRRFDLMR